AGLKFTPSANSTSSGTFQVQGSTTNSEGGLGGSVVTASITVAQVNDAPTSTNDSVTTSEDTPIVLSMSDFGTFADVDGDTVAGVTITTLESHGSLQYSSNGTDWSDVTLNQAVSKADIDAGHLRFAPAQDASGSNYDAIGFKVFDGKAYSDSAATLMVNVTAVNDAPGFGSAQSLAAVNEDTASPAGATLTSLLSGTFSDADGNTFAGIAITANGANSSTEGTWQYTTDGGSNWYAVGSRTTSAALLLGNTADTKLRFVPVSNYNGTPGALMVFAVDSSAATTWTSGSGAQTFDTTTDASDSKVSAAGVSLGTSIASINDSPTLSAGAPTATLVEKGGAYNGTVGTATSSITFTKGDVDGTASYDTAWLGTNGWVTTDSDATYTKKGTYGTATLTVSSGVVAYALDDSDSDTQALTAASSVTDLFTVRVTDGTATTIGDARFSITGTNDAPTLTGLEGKTVLENASAAFIDSSLAFGDVDSVNLDGGTLTVSGLDGEDVVSIATGVAHSNGAIQRDGNNVQVSDGSAWTTIGTIGTTTGTTGSGESLLITFNSSATPT
ncbi:hypothetical protein EKD02_09780, partial [Chlorobium phaeovibrioides]